ncbi:exodeoxyribonuclease VIII [Pseudescherichia vulneris]
MSEYTGCWYGDEDAIEENGAVRIAHSFEAANEKQARAKATLLFMEAFPEADDSLFELRIYQNAPEVPFPADEWDETFLFDHDWNEALGHPVAKIQATPVDFNKLQPSLRAAVLVKHGTTVINSEQLASAIALQQDESSSFDSHIASALFKMPSILAMHSERIQEAISFVRENSSTTKKWPEIKAVLAGWQKKHEADRKDGNVVAPGELNPGSGDPERFDLVVALLVMGKDPAKAGASDVKNAKQIKEAPDPAWRAWRTTLVGIPGIYSFPEQLLYELTLDGMKDLSLIKDSVGRRAYVREHFAGHPLLPDYLFDENDSHETEQNTAASAGVLEHEPAETHSVEPQHPDDEPATGAVETAPPVEESGPFYFLMADGEKVGRANKPAGLKKALADGGTEISQEEYQARKNGTYPAPQETIEKPAAQPEVKKIADGVFSIDNLMGEQPKAAAAAEPPAPSNEVEKVEVPAAQPAEPSFQSIGAALENDLAGKGDNMEIWRRVMRTDPRYTKDLAGAGFEGTSINAEYMVMRATEIFGPIGTGWGFEVMEDRMLPGAPMSEAIYEDKKFVGNRLLRDGDGTLITEENHSIKIKFWYAIEGDIRGEVEAYGATKYLYKTKHGITCDGEAQKKSLTDAIKKALSLLGFSADVWLGLYDKAEYKQENAIEFDIRNASDKAEDVTRIRKELDEKFKLNTESMRSAVTPNEVSGIASSLTRVMGVHLKAARDKADNEYVKYLEGRLRRLEEVKTECLTKLQEKAA